MRLNETTCTQFIDRLGSSAAVPGGGGASAYVGAIGAALSRMVGSLTVGKAKYAAVSDELAALNERALALEQSLLALVEADAAAFAPLAGAYALPKETPEQRAHKAAVMQHALIDALEPPLAIMAACCEGITLCEVYADKGSTLAVSDAGISAAALRAGLLGASLNVWINTSMLTDRTLADALNARAQAYIDEYEPRAARVFESVAARLKA